MLELNANAAPAADLIKDGTQDTFMADVVEASKTVPVIVDFWAPWCGPCKTLGPALEAAVTKAKGAVKMVKIDVDQNQQLVQMLAQQGLPMQSIPTVVAFFEGQIADMFQGALPQSQLDEFVGKLAVLGGGEADGGLADALEAAETMLAEGEAEDAVETFAAVLEEDPNSALAYSGLARSYLALDQVDQAEAVLNGVPADISEAPEIEAVYAQIALAKQAADAGPVAELRAAVEANPTDLQALFDLSSALHASGDAQGAVDALLDSFRVDRDWNDGAAKTQLFTIFDALPANDPIVLNGRRKLSSLIFV
ncbi:tetratricopeptide repeat protein [Aestuariibius sp. HNIBRBA575]|uniref:tetratricopeptide repeat protein n=1 Tax=Aestuariibius sp. HNIBRBA575 TaxID=3233343 RepID=UPI0034A17D88